MKKVLLLLFVAIGLAAQAQKVSNKLSFQKGQKLEMMTESKGTVSMELMGQPMENTFSSSVTRTFDVANVANGQATIEHKVKRIQFSAEAMGQSQSFDSEKEADMKSDMGKNMEKALKNKYTMTVDAKGKVTAVKPDDDNPNKDSADEDDPTAGMLQQFGADLELPKVGDATSFKVLPDKELSKGESWVDSTQKSPDIKGKTTYTVSSITDSDVVVDFVQDAKMQRTQDAMGTEANIAMDLKVTGKITLDRKTGLLKQRTANTEAKGAIEAGGQSLPMSTKGTETVTVKAM